MYKIICLWYGTCPSVCLGISAMINDQDGDDDQDYDDDQDDDYLRQWDDIECVDADILIYLYISIYTDILIYLLCLLGAVRFVRLCDGQSSEWVQLILGKLS